MRDASSGPLAGIRVIDMTTSYAGPSASMFLADLGATVVKIERPGRGDDARSWGPPFVGDTSAWFASANRNKQSVVIDLRSSAGIEVLHDLISHADVFMQSVNPSKLEQLQIDHTSLTSRFPRLVYCAMSGFGLDGPDSALPGYDLVAQARSGIMSVTGPDKTSPQRVSTALSDVVTGMCAALAISAAVVRQQRDGCGEVIDVSLLDTDLSIMAPRIAAYHAGEEEPEPSGGTDSVLAVYQSFPTADRDIVVAIGNDAMWQRFCGAVGLPELAAEAALADNAGRRLHRQRVITAVTERLRTRPAREWIKLLDECEVPASTVKRLSEVVVDQQVVDRGALLPVPGSDGSLVSIHSPFRLRSIQEPRNERFPDLGADTARALSELGYDESHIARLISRGTVQTSDGAADMELPA